MKRKSRSVRRVEHNATHTQRNSTHSAELNTELCRLCHGRFSTQKLQQVFGPGPSAGGPSAGGPSAAQPFSADFKQLLGVAVHRNSTLSAYVCTDCHAQFYQCNSILQSFKHRINTTPLHNNSTERSRSRSANTPHTDPTAPPILPDRRGLLSLVWWAHEHAGGCTSRPSLREVLEGGCGGALRAVWSCADGHAYTMESTSNCENDQDQTRNAVHTQSTAHRHTPTAASDGEHEAFSPVQLLEDSDLSDRNLYTDNDEDEHDETKRTNPQTDTCRKKSGKDVTNPEPKQRKKPGPKPGWKKKLRTEREDLPTIYKCPHQGCTAVYRGVDGMRKHVKEHHEEVRERPCPHPGCNKVFMIDRYLQRHVKLIHTEVRNYICDQCGQTFKQRKHLSVHQMRHSGAKPLQCEVCGFQCRQRASLKYHMTKHKAEAELEFACSVCERRFEKAHNLNVHMSMMHPLLQDNTHTRPLEVTDL